MRRIIDICWRLCKQVPLLPITILAAIPLALLGEWKPWGEAAWDSWISQVGVDGLSAFNPGVGQWIVIALVAYTIVVTVRGMIDDLRHGHVGVDLLAVVAIASTVAVQEYWAAWAVVLMISSGEAIEEFAQSKAESNLTALIDAAPRTAHVVVLPGMRGHVHASGSERTADVTDFVLSECPILEKRTTKTVKSVLLRLNLQKRTQKVPRRRMMRLESVSKRSPLIRYSSAT